MRRCNKCKVPLEGLLGKISNKIFKVKPSTSDPDICNKCEPDLSKADSPGKYHCQICNREIDERVALTHVKSEEYIINLIKKDHPEWDIDKKTCHKCADYYRRLVNEAEI